MSRLYLATRRRMTRVQTLPLISARKVAGVLRDFVWRTLFDCYIYSAQVSSHARLFYYIFQVRETRMSETTWKSPTLAESTPGRRSACQKRAKIAAGRAEMARWKDHPPSQRSTASRRQGQGWPSGTEAGRPVPNISRGSRGKCQVRRENISSLVDVWYKKWVWNFSFANSLNKSKVVWSADALQETLVVRFWCNLSVNQIEHQRIFIKEQLWTAG